MSILGYFIIEIICLNSLYLKYFIIFFFARTYTKLYNNCVLTSYTFTKCKIAHFFFTIFENQMSKKKMKRNQSRKSQETHHILYLNMMRTVHIWLLLNISTFFFSVVSEFFCNLSYYTFRFFLTEQNTF